MEKLLTSPCKGMNCGCTDGVSHSLECHAEHAAAVAGGYFVKAAQPPHPQPQAQPTLSPDDIHSCGEFCDLPECVAAREAQAQGEPTLPPLPEGKAVVRGPVSAFKEPEYGTLVDFDCEGPLSHCPADGEELFTADQVLAYGAACLQSHREAIAKHRAALVACVEALKLAKTIIVFNQRPTGNVGAATIDAAITNANQVLEGK